MYTFLLICHFLLAIVMVVVVLIQSGKGGGLGAGFGGGGANTLFGSSGGGNFFTKLTMALAAAFVITSLGLTKVKNVTLKTSIFDQSGSASPAPVVPTPAGGAAPGTLAAPIAPAVPGSPPVAPKPSAPDKK